MNTYWGMGAYQAKKVSIQNHSSTLIWKDIPLPVPAPWQCTQKRSFPLIISSVNVTNSQVNNEKIYNGKVKYWNETQSPNNSRHTFNGNKSFTPNPLWIVHPPVYKLSITVIS